MALRLPSRQPAQPLPPPAGRVPTRQPAVPLPSGGGAGGAGGGGTGVPEPPSDPLYGTGLHRSLRRGARAQAQQMSEAPMLDSAEPSPVGPGPVGRPVRMKARSQATSLREI